MPRTLILRALTLPARRGRASRPSPLAPRPSRGFTLIELLVVITIIAILAALLVVAATAAMNRARFARFKLEVDSVNQGVEDYKNKYGGDYPPNATIGTQMAGLSSPDTILPGIRNDLVRHFKKVAPRHREPEALIRGLAEGEMSSINGSSDGGSILAGGLSPAEALVFWLNGFSSDPKAPITGSGGPAYNLATNPTTNFGADGRQPVFPFETTRLGPRDDEGNFTGRSIQFQWPAGGPNYRINLWQYFPPNSEQPLVYFDTSRPLVDVEPRLFHAIKQASTTAANEIRYANEGKFQILHCGLDGIWGTPAQVAQLSIVGKTSGQLSSQMLLFPTGPFTLDLADTVTNFTTGTLEDAQP